MDGTYLSIHCNQRYKITSELKKEVTSYFAENMSTGVKFSIDRSFIEHLIKFKSWKRL